MPRTRPMAIGTSTTELAFMLADAGVLVMFGSQRTRGLFDPEETTIVDEQGMRLTVRETTLAIPPGTLTGLRVDSSITVDGAAYRVRAIGRRRNDGLVPLTVVEA